MVGGLCGQPGLDVLFHVDSGQEPGPGRVLLHLHRMVEIRVSEIMISLVSVMAPSVQV